MVCPGVWLRFFIKPPLGYAIAYVDWNAAEFGIAAVLSGDEAMKLDYETGDPHLGFAKAAKAVPQDATKDSHGAQRDRYNSCNFGILYGMGQTALAGRISDDCNYPMGFAAGFIADHHRRYKAYWKWAETVQDHASLCGYLQTMLGWHVRSHGQWAISRFKAVAPN